MGERTKLFANKFILILAISSFAVSVLEGVLYYSDAQVFFRILLIFDNSISTFTFTPDISLEEALEFMDLHNSFLYNVVGYLYGVAVFSAPYCTIAVAYKALENVLRFVFIFHRGKTSQKVIIFGYNESTKSLIKNYSFEKNKKVSVHIVSNAEFDSSERYELIKKGYVLHNFDILKAEGEDIHYLLKKAEADSADNIIIFNDNSVENFSLLQVFSLIKGDGRFVLKAGAKITCRCEDDSIRELIADYYNIGKNESCYDLEIVSIPELQVRKMFDEFPLHSYYLNTDTKLDDWNVHLLIMGFGSIGQQTLLQAMNLGVVSKRNSIVVDVYDIDIESKMEIFTNRFSSDTFYMDQGTIRIKNTSADGTFIVNCHNLNIKYREFIEQVRLENSRNPYTYSVIAIDDINGGVNCAMRLANIFDEDGKAGTPIILRMDNDRILAKYISANNRTFSNVQLMYDMNGVISLELILNKEINIMAKEFHYFYSAIQIIGKDETPWKSEENSMEEFWNHTSMFKRDSSKALAAHESVKQVIFERLERELNIDVDEQINSEIGENGSLVEYNGKIWRLMTNEDDFIKALMNDKFAGFIADLEHRRWCYFVASQGWRYGSVRNDDKKTHTCLQPIGKLLQGEKTKTTYKYDIMSLMLRYINNKNKQ